VFGTSMTELKVYAKALWKSRPVQLISGRGVRGRAMARIEMAALSQELVQKDGGT